MPQLTNITIGPAVTVALSSDRLFRVVPQVPGSASVAFEHSAVGSPELATKISAATRRKPDMAQASMIRSTIPVIREVNNVGTRVGASVIESSFNFPKQATEAERQEALDLHIKALKHTFFTAVLISGEAMS